MALSSPCPGADLVQQLGWWKETLSQHGRSLHPRPSSGLQTPTRGCSAPPRGQGDRPGLAFRSSGDGCCSQKVQFTGSELGERLSAKAHELVWQDPRVCPLPLGAPEDLAGLSSSHLEFGLSWVHSPTPLCPGAHAAAAISLLPHAAPRLALAGPTIPNLQCPLQDCLLVTRCIQASPCGVLTHLHCRELPPYLAERCAVFQAHHVARVSLRLLCVHCLTV